MRDFETLRQILQICFDIDKRAYSLYRRFSKMWTDERLRSFWTKMAAEEKQHLKYWQNLLQLTEENSVPQVFDDPISVREQLAGIIPKVDALIEQCECSIEPTNCFLVSLRLEFLMLHPAFEHLFTSLKTYAGDWSPWDSYEEHIKSFITFFREYDGEKSPELDLLAEALETLWQDNRKLNYQSQRDELTGVWNRRGFFQAIIPLAHLAMRNKTAIGIMMIDLDNFKDLNDTLGHPQGDTILKYVAHTLVSSVRSADIVGRYGGDEFIVFLTQLDAKDLERVAEKIRSAIEEDQTFPHKISVSIGLCHSFLHEYGLSNIETMIGSADKFLYQAKKAGRNQVIINACEE